MKKAILIVFMFFLSTSLFAGIIATYNLNNKKKSFTDKDLEIYLKDIPVQFRAFVVKDKSKFAENIIFKKLAAIEAKKLGLDKNKDVKKEIEAQIEKVLAKHYLENKVGTYKFSDKELMEYYNKNKSKFKEKAGYKFGKLKFDTLDEALKVFNDIQKRKNFEQYEGLNNSNPLAKILKNRYESPDRLPKKLKNILNSLKPGEVSAPFEYNGKYFIVKLRDKRVGGIQPFEKVKHRIKNILKQQKKRELMERVKNNLLKKYDVKLLKK